MLQKPSEVTHSSIWRTHHETMENSWTPYMHYIRKEFLSARQFIRPGDGPVQIMTECVLIRPGDGPVQIMTQCVLIRPGDGPVQIMTQCELIRPGDAPVQITSQC